MEGYAGVGSNCEDFDDLNIEKRFTSAGWRKNITLKLKSEESTMSAFQQKVKLQDGSYEFVFQTFVAYNSEAGRETRHWHCRICDEFISHFEDVQFHATTKKHVQRLSFPSHPNMLFRKKMPSVYRGDSIQLAHGEPLPPGSEDENDRGKHLALDKIPLPSRGSEGEVRRVTHIQTPMDSIPLPPYDAPKHSKNIQEADRWSTFNKARKYYDRTKLRARDSDINSSQEPVFKVSGNVSRDRASKERRPSPRRTSGASLERHGSSSKSEQNLGKDSIDKRSLSPISSGSVSRSRSRSRSRMKASTKSTVRSRSRSRARSTSRNRIKSRARSRSGSPPFIKTHGYKQGREGVSRQYHKRSRSRSLSPSSGSKSKSRRSRSKSHGSVTKLKSRRSRSKSHGSGSKSKSRRSRSKSKTRRSRSKSKSRRSRSKSKTRHRRSRSKSNQRDRSGLKTSDVSSDSKNQNRKKQSVSPEEKNKNPAAEKMDERKKWELFRHEFGKIEQAAVKQLKFHEKNPEKHPLYPEEWKKFWNRRYKELQAEGKDPSSHDFKPEWIEFWNKRMLELHEEEIKNKKEELKEKFGLPDDEHPVPLKFVPPSNSKNKNIIPDKKNIPKQSSSPYEHQPSGRKQSYSEKKRNHSNKNEKSESSKEAEIMPILRLLTAMEAQLSSLGPQVNNLMAKALALQKVKPLSADSLLNDTENIVLFETIKEKLRGQLLAGIVEKHLLPATEKCLGLLLNLLKKVEQKKFLSVAVEKSPTVDLKINAALPATEPVVVPGVGTVDKVAIAQQIAAALIAQGKTDVTQAELEQLINAVVGMAEASRGSNNPITAAQFAALQKQHIAVNTVGQNQTVLSNKFITSTVPMSPLEHLLSVVTSKPSSYNASSHGLTKDAPSGLQLLQTAYDEPRISPLTKLLGKDEKSSISSQPHASSSDDTGNMTRTEEEISHLSEEELQALLQNFKDLSGHEQQCLITYLRKLEETDPSRVEKLRKYVNMEPQKTSATPVSETLSSKPSIVHPLRSGRLSPFSSRLGGSNPPLDEKEKREKIDTTETKPGSPDLDSDEDYSFEDIYAAASKKVKEHEAAKAEELQRGKLSMKEPQVSSSSQNKTDDPTLILKETKEMIANLMGQLPSKFVQKHTAVSSPKKDMSVSSSLTNTDNSLTTVAGSNLDTMSTYSVQSQPSSNLYMNTQPAQQHFSDAPLNVVSSQHFTEPVSNTAPPQHFAESSVNAVPPQHFSQYQESNYTAPYRGPSDPNYQNTTPYPNSYGEGYNSYYSGRTSGQSQHQYAGNFEGNRFPPPNRFQDSGYSDQFAQPPYQESGDYYVGQRGSYY